MRWLAAALVAFLLLATAGSAAAHPSHWLTVHAEIRLDGTFVVDVFLDREFLANRFGQDAPVVEIAGLPAAKDLRQESFGLLAAFGVVFDGTRAATDALWIPQRKEEELHLRLTGKIPPGARTIDFDNRTTGPWAASVRHEGEEGAALAMFDPHEKMKPVELHFASAPMATALEFSTAGFLHVVARRLDHALFLLGLLVLSVRKKPLFTQAIAFMAAQFAAFALAATGVVSTPASVVEPLVAASIVYVAVENLFTQKLHVWRVFLVFAFGLFHGLVLADAAADLRPPAAAKAVALVSFGAGVEVAQVCVLAAAWLALAAFREKPWFRARVVMPASIAVAVLGVWWAVTQTT